MQGDLPAARGRYEESLAVRRDLGDRPGVALSLNNLGILAARLEDFDMARAYLDESLAIKREIGDRNGAANCLYNLGLLAADQEDYSSSRKYLAEGLDLFYKIGGTPGITNCLTAFSMLAIKEKRWEAGVCLLAFSSGLRETGGVALAAEDQAARDHDMEMAREALGDAAYTAARDRGRALEVAQAISLANESPLD